MLQVRHSVHGGLTNNPSGFKLSVVEELVFKSGLRHQTVDATGARPACSQAHWLRVKDRVFAACSAHSDGVAWLQVVSLKASGYSAIVLGGDAAGMEVELDHTGVGLLDGMPFIVEHIDDGRRHLATDRDEAVSNYKIFRELGIATPLERHLSSRRMATNQIHFNASSQAIHCLGLGDYFVAGGHFWIVRFDHGHQFVGQRLSDDVRAHFNPGGSCVESKSLKVDCVVFCESDYEPAGWAHEYMEQLHSGVPDYQLFDLRRGGLVRAQVGERLLLQPATRSRITCWEVVQAAPSELLIKNAGAVGAICPHTGRVAGAAIGLTFKGLAHATPWMGADLASMAQKLLSGGSQC